MTVRIAPRARADIAGILAWTRDNFGPRTLARYANLIETAIEQVAADPVIIGSEHRPEIAAHCRTYHLVHARKHAGRRGNRIRSPRHFLLYRVAAGDVVEIGRVLHDSMEMERHLPEEYRRSAE
jgi:toxin ParE1/3/4